MVLLTNDRVSISESAITLKKESILKQCKICKNMAKDSHEKSTWIQLDCHILAVIIWHEDKPTATNDTWVCTRAVPNGRFSIDFSLMDFAHFTEFSESWKILKIMFPLLPLGRFLFPLISPKRYLPRDSDENIFYYHTFIFWILGKFQCS